MVHKIKVYVTRITRKGVGVMRRADFEEGSAEPGSGAPAPKVDDLEHMLEEME